MEDEQEFILPESKGCKPAIDADLDKEHANVVNKYPPLWLHYGEIHLEKLKMQCTEYLLKTTDQYEHHA